MDVAAHARSALAIALANALVLASCGGPSVPSELPSTSPLSPRAEAAPLPIIGASLEERPLAVEAPSADPHAGHRDHGAPFATDAGTPEEHGHGQHH